jgi:hypothetical protein
VVGKVVDSLRVEPLAVAVTRLHGLVRQEQVVMVAMAIIQPLEVMVVGVEAVVLAYQEMVVMDRHGKVHQVTRQQRQVLVVAAVAAVVIILILLVVVVLTILV